VGGLSVGGSNILQKSPSLPTTLCRGMVIPEIGGEAIALSP
jgi:hypothetical protein